LAQFNYSRAQVSKTYILESGEQLRADLSQVWETDKRQKVGKAYAQVWSQAEEGYQALDCAWGHTRLLLGNIQFLKSKPEENNPEQRKPKGLKQVFFHVGKAPW
jgi:hypothetical protein